MTLTLNQIRDNTGANTKRKRVGRGRGSGYGGTAGRGDKGFKSRSGTSVAGFEGGQTPLYRRLPKHGFRSIFKKYYNLINLYKLEKWLADGKIKADETLTPKRLKELSLITKPLYGVKILGDGDISHKVSFSVNKISKVAKEKIESAGGNVNIIEDKKK